LTLTDEEKAEVRASGERAQRILDRADSLPMEHLLKLHGTIRGLTPSDPEPRQRSDPFRWSAWDNWANKTVVQSIQISGTDLKPGDRVRLRPCATFAREGASSKRADIFDSVLHGRVAIIASIEQDFEDNVHVAVVVE